MGLSLRDPDPIRRTMHPIRTLPPGIRPTCQPRTLMCWPLCQRLAIWGNTSVRVVLLLGTALVVGFCQGEKFNLRCLSPRGSVSTRKSNKRAYVCRPRTNSWERKPMLAAVL
eukprot:5843453-Amphidinium_carterae.1